MRRDLRVLKTILPAWAIALLRRLRDLLRRGRQLHLQTPRARREAALQELEALPQRPLISLVMPTYKTDLKYLREAVDSVLGQHYPDWELIVVDDASGDPALEQALSRYDAAHARIKYRQLEHNAGISAATNAGMELAEGEFVGFLDHDDTLTPDALLRVAQALAHDPELDVVYSDSDKLTIGGVRADPFLKPDWSPVYALGAMYIGHLLVVRTAVAYRPVARPVVRAAAFVGTAAVVGSVVSTLPPACHSVIVGGVAYQECGTSWYRPYYSGTTINYTVVNPPR